MQTGELTTCSAPQKIGPHHFQTTLLYSPIETTAQKHPVGEDPVSIWINHIFSCLPVGWIAFSFREKPDDFERLWPICNKREMHCIYLTALAGMKEPDKYLRINDPSGL